MGFLADSCIWLLLKVSDDQFIPIGMLLLLILFCIVHFSYTQAPYYPNHWYGANQGNAFTGIVPGNLSEPLKIGGTLAPHVCGFNPVTRQCMDPEHFCPGRCINFAYTYNVRYECRCLVVKI